MRKQYKYICMVKRKKTSSNAQEKIHLLCFPLLQSVFSFRGGVAEVINYLVYFFAIHK